MSGMIVGSLGIMVCALWTAIALWTVYDIRCASAPRRRAIHRRSHLETGYYGAKFDAVMKGTKC